MWGRTPRDERRPRPRALATLEFLVVQYRIFLIERDRQARPRGPPCTACHPLREDKGRTFTNTERRCMRANQVVAPPPPGVRQGWEVLADFGTRLGLKLSYPRGNLSA
eukprot:TRINITY_DN150_c0_g1_i10.p3 TRINITY_DN150_c0_g1~~TRINITY_DN150_c0_g1_i10.p3  ORF type:complete len:108 (+),score=5.66 TRINITY_DN150_c0_g1_i10:573-896(+)